MHRNKFAHGDLQHGNIIVNDNGELFLVDYDSFYCPSLKGEPEIITGLKDYQHPARRNNLIVSEKLDYFSELIIYLSILAIAHNPALVDKYQVKDSERMLFSADDFSNIKYSDIYKDILALGQEFVVYLQILEIYLSKTSISDLEPFDILLERLTKDPVINKFSASCGKKTLNGKSIVLSWDVENYTQILLDGKDVTTQISNTLTLNSSTTYTLTVINGHKRISKSIKVSSFASPAVAVTASKTKLHKGRNESVTINWGVQNAEKITGKTKLFISYNNMESGTYHWRVFATNKSTLLKSQYTTGSFEFTYTEPPTSDNCCPKNLTSAYIEDLENTEFIIGTNMQYWIFYEYYNPEYDYWEPIQKTVTGSEAAWPFFANVNDYTWACGGCVPYMSNGSYVSWSRRDGLKMVADKHVRLRLSECYCCATFAFEGSENGTVWTEIARIQTDSSDYTHPLTQIAVYTHFRIRSLCDTKLRKIEVD